MFSTLRWQSLGFLIGSIMLCGSLAQAATYHVSKTGNNGNSCATAQSAGSSAKLTIAAGLACLSPGDTLTIRAGTYTGEPEMSPPPGATIQGAAGETVIIRPTTDRTSLFISRNNDLTYRNFIVEQGSTAFGFGEDGSGGNNFLVEDVEIRYMTSAAGIGTDGPTNQNGTIRRVNIHHMGYTTSGASRCFGNGDDRSQSYNGYCHGLYIGSGGLTIEQSMLHNNNGIGAQLYPNNVQNITLRNTKIFNNRDNGVVFQGNGLLAYNNVIYKNGSRAFWNIGGSTNLRFYNNTLVQNGLGVSEGGSPDMRNTLVSGSSTGLSGGNNNVVVASSCFQNAGGDDYHLVTGCSQAINTGQSLANVFTTDIERNSRPGGSAWDVGAYEFGAPSTVVLSAPANFRMVSGF